MGTIATIVHAIFANLRSWPPFYPRSARALSDPVIAAAPMAGGDRYRVEATEWGAEAEKRPSRVRSFLDSLSDESDKSEESDESDKSDKSDEADRVGGRGFRLPDASALPSPLGLLTCATDPRKREFFRPRWAI